MARYDDFIPHTDAAFNTWFKNLCQYVNTKCSGQDPEWTHIPSEAREKLNAAYAAWYTAYALTLKPHTPVETEAKNRMRVEAEAVIREFVNEYIRYSSHVTDEDLAAVGMRRRAPPHPVKVPTTSPRLRVDTGTRRRIIVYYVDEESGRRGKPKGVHGVEIRWAVLDHYPASDKELVNSSFDTKQPLTLEFDEGDRGKHIYLCGRWEINREGEKGPSGAIDEAVIP